MNDPTLKAKAYSLAESTPKHLDKPTTPPQAWRQEGDELIVLLADGRKVRAPYVIARPALRNEGNEAISKPKPARSAPDIKELLTTAIEEVFVNNSIHHAQTVFARPKPTRPKPVSKAATSPPSTPTKSNGRKP